MLDIGPFVNVGAEPLWITVTHHAAGYRWQQGNLVREAFATVGAAVDDAIAYHSA